MNPQAYAARQRATYFQVPLCAFAFGASIYERLDTIVSFGVVEAGAKAWERLTADQRNEFLRTHRESCPQGLIRNDPRYLYAAVGARVTKVRLGDLTSTLNRHHALADFRDTLGRLHGPDPSVRLRTDLVFEARDGKGLSPAELAILAAIYSVIGKKQGPVRITQDRIRCRALGYKSQPMFASEFPVCL